MLPGAVRRAARRVADVRLVDPEDREFREYVWDFFERSLTPDFKDGPEGGGEVSPELVDESLAFARLMVDEGLLTYSWPVEYGGQGGRPLRQAIISEAMGYFRAPMPLHAGVDIAGPGFMTYGSAEQKRELLPKIADATIIINSGLTEPDAGSDLASLKTAAVRDGDVYVINGQKTFQSRAHYATHALLAVRTNPLVPKHRGISLLLVDLTLPGIVIRPQWNIMDGRQNEIFFENVRVPVDCLLGVENEGWPQLRATLGYERSGVHVYGRILSFFDELQDYCRAFPPRDPRHIGRDMAGAAVALSEWRALSYRVVEREALHETIGVEASESTLKGKLVKPLLADLAVSAIGPSILIDSRLSSDDQAARTRHNFHKFFRESRSDHVRGTVEVQKNIIALRGMGLPSN